MSEKLLEVVHYIGRDSGKTEELLNLLKGIYSRMVGESKNIQELLRCLSLSSFSPGQKEIIKKLIMSVFVDEILDPDFKLDGSLRSIVTEMINNGYIKLIDGKEYDSEGMNIIIHLPEIKDKGFGGFCRKYFIPKGDFSEEMLKKELQLHPEYEEKLESPKGVSEILECLRQYMKVRKVVVDEEIDDYYEYFDGKNRKHKTCETGEILKWILEVQKGKEGIGLRGNQFQLQGGIVLDCYKDMCRFIDPCFFDTNNLRKTRKILLRVS